MTTSFTDLQLWLLEAMLSASAADEIEAQQLLRLPESFPFAFTVSVADLRKYEGSTFTGKGWTWIWSPSAIQRWSQPPKPLAKLRKPKMAEAADLVQPSLFDRQT